MTLNTPFQHPEVDHDCSDMKPYLEQIQQNLAELNRLEALFVTVDAEARELSGAYQKYLQSTWQPLNNQIKKLRQQIQDTQFRMINRMLEQMVAPTIN